MTEQTLQVIAVAALTALPSTIAAMAAWRQAYRAHVETKATLALSTETKQQTDVIIEKTEAIHATAGHIVELTNSTMTRLKEDLVAAKEEIKELKALLLQAVSRLEGEPG